VVDVRRAEDPLEAVAVVGEEEQRFTGSTAESAARGG
jgi:hypothetical protein